MSMLRKSGSRIIIGVAMGFAAFFGGFLAIEFLLLPERLVDAFNATASPSAGIWAELAVNIVLYGVLTPFVAVMGYHLLAPKGGTTSQQSTDS